MNTLLRDLRYAYRMLLEAPVVSAVAVLSLSLGIAVNTMECLPRISSTSKRPRPRSARWMRIRFDRRTPPAWMSRSRSTL